MKIDSCDQEVSFIQKQTYNKDVIISKKEVFSPWWREKGHLLSKGDLKEVFREKPEVLIIGSGAASLMKVPEEVKKSIEAQGIQCLVFNTREACDKFNELELSGKKVTAALHLTC